MLVLCKDDFKIDSFYFQVKFRDLSTPEIKIIKIIN